MANGVQSVNARVIFTMFSDVQTINLNFNSIASGTSQVGDVIDVPVGTWINLNTQSLNDIRWAAFTNEGSGSSNGSIAVRISGSTTDLTYLKNPVDTSIISMQSGSIPKLIATAYVSASYLNYKLQES